MDGTEWAFRSIDICSRDGETRPPNIVDGHRDGIFKWFQSFTDTDAAQARILCLHLDSVSNAREYLDNMDALFGEEVIKHAIWRPEVYRTLRKDAAGGASGLTDSPACFILQTPMDNGPFCSMALRAYPNVVKGIYIYDEEAFDPAIMTGGEASRSGWRSTGFQIITLPEMFLQAHSRYTSQLLPGLVSQISMVEASLATENPSDFSALTQTLHACYSDLIDMERRSRFEETIISAIETIAESNRYGTVPWPSLAPQKAAIASRKFDFETLPRRIENCRAAIHTLTQRRTEQLNLELAQHTHQIAEAAMKDNQSMKTIAIMTMILLPGTAVASLFSMGLFDWTAEDGGRIASKWLWIYFVVSVPLTGAILTIWWMWTRRHKEERSSRGDDRTLLTSKDEEAAAAGRI